MEKYLLFISNTCHKCPQAKEVIKDKNVLIINCSEEEGLKKAREYDVTQVPTLISLTKVFRASDIEDIKNEMQN